MKNHFKNFSYPSKTIILIFSLVLLIFPSAILFSMGKNIITANPVYLRLIFLVPTFFAAIGFIYCTLGYHFQILRGDELKLKIHLEALNIAFTTTLVFFFVLIFLFLNFNPTWLNYLIVILSIILIVAYVVGVEIVKRKYR